MASERNRWWPTGHHLSLKQNSTKDTTMTFEQSLNLAELEADLAFERYLEAFNADEHPEMLEALTTEAQFAQERYDEIINLVPAH